MDIQDVRDRILAHLQITINKTHARSIKWLSVARCINTTFHQVIDQYPRLRSAMFLPPRPSLANQLSPPTDFPNPPLYGETFELGTSSIRFFKMDQFQSGGQLILKCCIDSSRYRHTRHRTAVGASWRKTLFFSGPRLIFITAHVVRSRARGWPKMTNFTTDGTMTFGEFVDNLGNSCHG